MSASENDPYHMAESHVVERLEEGSFKFGNADDIANLIGVVAEIFYHLPPCEKKPYDAWLWQRVGSDLVGFLLQMKELFDVALSEGVLTDEWLDAHIADSDPEHLRELVQDFRLDFRAILETAISSNEYSNDLAA